MKDITLLKIKEKKVKIQLKDLYNEQYDSICFCFLIIGKDYIKGFL